MSRGGFFEPLKPRSSLARTAAPKAPAPSAQYDSSVSLLPPVAAHRREVHLMNVSVCIAATRADTVGAAVRSIVSQTYQDWELVVVAQGGASDSIAAAVKDALGGREGKVVRDAGRGLSRARNAAIAAADGDVLAMIDDDCEADPEWLEAILSRLTRNSRVGVVTGTVVAPPKAKRGLGNCPASYPADVLYDPAVSGHQPPEGFDWIGANFALTRTAAEAIGPFDEYLGAGARFSAGEDADYRWRAVEQGIVMQVAPESIVRHTYGWRYGLRALHAFQRGYARGGGAFAAKLTLLGDPWGSYDLNEQRRKIAHDWRPGRRSNLPASTQHTRLAALPIAIRRYLVFASAYRECMTDFRVDARALLQAA